MRFKRAMTDMRNEMFERNLIELQRCMQTQLKDVEDRMGITDQTNKGKQNTEMDYRHG